MLAMIYQHVRPTVAVVTARKRRCGYQVPTTASACHVTTAVAGTATDSRKKLNVLKRVASIQDRELTAHPGRWTPVRSLLGLNPERTQCCAASVRQHLNQNKDTRNVGVIPIRLTKVASVVALHKLEGNTFPGPRVLAESVIWQTPPHGKTRGNISASQPANMSLREKPPINLGYMGHGLPIASDTTYGCAVSWYKVSREVARPNCQAHQDVGSLAYGVIAYSKGGYMNGTGADGADCPESITASSSSVLLSPEVLHEILLEWGTPEEGAAVRSVVSG